MPITLQSKVGLQCSYLKYISLSNVWFLFTLPRFGILYVCDSKCQIIVYILTVFFFNGREAILVFYEKNQERKKLFCFLRGEKLSRRKRTAWSPNKRTIN